MIKNIAEVLQWKFPNARCHPLHEHDFLVDDLGGGPIITFWDEQKLGPRPTPAQLAQWATEFAAKPEPTEDDLVDAMLAKHGVTAKAFKRRLAKEAG